MLKEEFEERIHKTVSPDEWKIIEFVYTWYPGIDDICGKAQIAEIYMAGGMTVVRDMYERAAAHQDYTQLVSRKKAELEQLRIWNAKNHRNSYCVTINPPTYTLSDMEEYAEAIRDLRRYQKALEGITSGRDLRGVFLEEAMDFI